LLKHILVFLLLGQIVFVGTRLIYEGLLSSKWSADSTIHCFFVFSIHLIVNSCEISHFYHWHPTLVGGFKHVFPYIGNVIIPTDELHDFSEGQGEKPPTVILHGAFLHFKPPKRSLKNQPLGAPDAIGAWIGVSVWSVDHQRWKLIVLTIEHLHSIWYNVLRMIDNIYN